MQAVACRLPPRCGLAASDSAARISPPASLDGSSLRAISPEAAAAASTDSPLVCRVTAGVTVTETDGPGGFGGDGGSGDNGSGDGRSWGEGGANEGDDEDITLLSREQVLSASCLVHAIAHGDAPETPLQHVVTTRLESPHISPHISTSQSNDTFTVPSGGILAHQCPIHLLGMPHARL